LGEKSVRHGGRQFSFSRTTIVTARVSHQSPVTLHYHRAARVAWYAFDALTKNQGDGALWLQVHYIGHHMVDLAALLKDGSPEKGSFLSRVFGIFSEEIIRIWARDQKSPYNLHERRPTLYDDENRSYTLDFLFEKNGDFFVSEMKCEVQYQNYKYWRLTNLKQLEHHLSKTAFKLFLKLSENSHSVPVHAGEPLEVKGTVLVWGAATLEGIAAVRDRYGISDVLTVESCVRDLIEWNNLEYQAFLREREQWLLSLFNGLRTG
jgi:hypothetical protein